MDKSGVVPVIVPTRDEQGLVGRTTACLWNVLHNMGKEPIYIHASCIGYARVRTDSFIECRKFVDTDRPRGFMIDDDILTIDQDGIMKAIIKADQNKWNLVGPYRTKNDRICLCHADGEMMKLDDYKKLKPYERVAMAGLGFYYGDLPLKYQFHADGQPFLGEDLNFWFDNQDLEPRVAPVQLKHLKVMAI
jgi:hypothetical protein